MKLFNVGGECAGPRAHEPQCIIPPGVQTSSEYSIHLDDALDVRVTVKAGEHQVSASFEQTGAQRRPKVAVDGAAVEDLAAAWRSIA